MNIDNVNISNVIGAYQNAPLARQKGEAARQSDSTRSGRPDPVELSPRITELEKLKKAAGALPDVRLEKVSTLKEQISAGTYNIDGASVAEKMAEHFKVSGGGGSR